jgi:hypothetical protein
MNNNIQESYCSFEVSKLLKEKRFEQLTQKAFIEDGTEYQFETTPQNYNDENGRFYKTSSRPTHSLAIEWIRVNFGIWIEIITTYPNKYEYNIYKLPDIDNQMAVIHAQLNSPQEATEAALLYTLQNLI